MANILTTVLTKLAHMALEALLAQLAKSLLTVAFKPRTAPAAA
ncbi:hypothetical protein [Streptomyces himastatinicus]|nr:hypothetical protein [Streptomyces himastatinicus]